MAIEKIETHRFPADLPYPATPTYSIGKYGAWTLHEKSRITSERGYFTGFDEEPKGHFLVRDGDIWMSTSRLERESHAIHVKHARGNVVVCGVGMGMYLYNIAALPAVTKIVAVEIDADIIDLVQRATNFASWPGHEKISFVNRNALELSPADIGNHPIDYLYVDIWPELGNPEAIPHTQAIQAMVNARRVGWWGQELDFMEWLFDRRPRDHVATPADLLEFIRATGLRVEEQSPSYLLACRHAAAVFSGYRSHLLHRYALEAKSGAND